jgi:hypothetical protein
LKASGKTANGQRLYSQQDEQKKFGQIEKLLQTIIYSVEIAKEADWGIMLQLISNFCVRGICFDNSSQSKRFSIQIERMEEKE